MGDLNIVRSPAADEQGDAIQYYLDAKLAKDAAAKAFAKAEKGLLQFVDGKSEGTSSVKVGGQYKITRIDKINRSIDEDAYAEIKEDIPAAILARVFRQKLMLDLTQLRYVQQNEPEVYSDISRALTAKPAKPSIRVEVLS